MSIKRLANASITGAGGKSSKLWDQTTTMGTYESIATITVNDNTGASIVFSNIPQNYTHLQIRANVTLYYASGSGVSAYYLANVNGITVGSYNHQIYGNGTGAYGTTDSNIPIAYCQYNVTPTYYAPAVIDFLDYTNTSKNKTIRSFSGWDANGSGVVGSMSDLISANTNAISTIALSSGGAYFAINSQFALYGIRGA